MLAAEFGQVEQKKIPLNGQAPFGHGSGGVIVYLLCDSFLIILGKSLLTPSVAPTNLQVVKKFEAVRASL